MKSSFKTKPLILPASIAGTFVIALFINGSVYQGQGTDLSSTDLDTVSKTAQPPTPAGYNSPFNVVELDADLVKQSHALTVDRHHSISQSDTFSDQSVVQVQDSLVGQFLSPDLQGEIHTLHFADAVLELQKLQDSDPMYFEALLKDYVSLAPLELKSLFLSVLESLNPVELERFILNRLHEGSDTQVWRALVADIGLSSESGVDMLIGKTANTTDINSIVDNIRSLRPERSESDVSNTISMALQEHVQSEHIAVREAVVSMAGRSSDDQNRLILKQGISDPDERVRASVIDTILENDIHDPDLKQSLLGVISDDNEKLYMRSNAFYAVLNMNLNEQDRSVVNAYRPLIEAAM